MSWCAKSEKFPCGATYVHEKQGLKKLFLTLRKFTGDVRRGKYESLLEFAENAPRLCLGDESGNFQMSAPGGRSSSSKNAMVAARECLEALLRGSTSGSFLLLYFRAEELESRFSGLCNSLQHHFIVQVNDARQFFKGSDALEDFDRAVLTHAANLLVFRGAPNIALRR